MEKRITFLTHDIAKPAPYLHRLPIELLQHLLCLAVAEIRQGHEPWHVYSRIAELRLVCTHWLAAIDSYPLFWTLLTNRLSPLLVSIVLQKSGTLPLHIDLSYIARSDTNPPFHYVNTVISLARRWSSLNIRWFSEEEEEGVEEALRNVLLTPAPQLKELAFDGFSDVPGGVSLFDDVAPNLDSITTRHAVPNWSSFVMRGLRKLAVVTVVPKASDLENLVQVLAASPNMEELHIRGWIPRSGSIPENHRVKLEPIALDCLHSLTLRVFPSSWANALLEAIRFPHRCSMDIALELPSAQAPLSELLKHLKTRLAGSSLMGVVLDARERFLSIVLMCQGTDEVGEASVMFRYPTGMAFLTSDTLLLWQSSLAEITEAVQASGIPVHLVMSVSLSQTPNSIDHPMTTALKLADESLPSVHKASISGSNIQQFFQYITLPTFPNLSDLEVSEAETVSWETILECVAARSELLAVPGSKIKALQSLALPSGSVDDEGFEKLSRVVENVYRK
ncbi:hypothetical protein FRC00_000910 [Tulasnella sp. 408]|nr:hypothetical protein FRC00_000910 [Tulasnella sp. 408]